MLKFGGFLIPSNITMNAYNSQVKPHFDYRFVVRVNYGKSFQVASEAARLLPLQLIGSKAMRLKKFHVFFFFFFFI